MRRESGCDLPVFGNYKLTANFWRLGDDFEPVLSQQRLVEFTLICVFKFRVGHLI